MAEQNNELLLKNRQSCPTRSMLLPKPIPHLSKFLDMSKDVEIDEVEVKDMVVVKVVVDTILDTAMVLKIKGKIQTTINVITHKMT